MSEWKSSSPLSRVNQYAGVQPVHVPRDLFNTVHRAVEIAELTNGAFDPTWAAMWSLWDFDTPSMPTAEEVLAQLPLVNWERIELSGQSIFLPQKGMVLGLGGIAKGIALDRAKKALLQRSINNFIPHRPNS